MITGITIKNFKSLADFSMSLDQFNCLIGLNGAGKTTILQALDFIGHLACGETDFRDWEKKDFITNGSNLRTLFFQVNFKITNKTRVLLSGEIVSCSEEFVSWTGKYNIDKQRFSEEQIYSVSGHHELHLGPTANYINPLSPTNLTYLSLKDNQLFHIVEKSIWNADSINQVLPHHTEIKDVSDYKYKGSVLSAFKFNNYIIETVQKELQSLKSLEQLYPDILRHVSQGNKPVERSGEGLPGFLGSMKESDAQNLATTLKDFYPEVSQYEIKRKKFGWRALLVREAALKNPVSATHINDGYLRILAMLSQKYSDASFLLFDEIENGINQELIEKLLTELQNFNGKQVLVTTHSALVLNYLTDEAAQKSVIFLFKDSEGHTHAQKFFDIEGMREKLQLLGPGEVMADTNLEELSHMLANKLTTENK